MRVIMLGTGAALPDPDRCQTGILLTVRGRHYLFDCGYGATHQMIRANVHPATVDHIFLTHLHHDHIADFPFFMISSWMTGRKNPPIVLGPDDTQHFVDCLFKDGAFRKDMQARSGYKQRQDNLHVMTPDVREYGPGLIYEDDLVKVTACHVIHIPKEISPCFAFRMDTVDGQSVVFSGDTAPCDDLIELSQGADLLIHECTFPEEAIEFRSKAGVGTWAHTSPTELGEIATKAKVKSVVATHFGHFDSCYPVMRQMMAHHMPPDAQGPELIEGMVADIRKNWKGELRMAHDLMRIDL